MNDLLQVVKTDPEQVCQYFLMKISALTIQMRSTGRKISHTKHFMVNETLSQKLGFSKNPTALTLLSKVPPCTIS